MESIPLFPREVQNGFQRRIEALDRWPKSFVQEFRYINLNFAVEGRKIMGLNRCKALSGKFWSHPRNNFLIQHVSNSIKPHASVKYLKDYISSCFLNVSPVALSPAEGIIFLGLAKGDLNKECLRQ